MFLDLSKRVFSTILHIQSQVTFLHRVLLWLPDVLNCTAIFFTIFCWLCCCHFLPHLRHSLGAICISCHQFWIFQSRIAAILSMLGLDRCHGWQGTLAIDNGRSLCLPMVSRKRPAVERQQVRNHHNRHHCPAEVCRRSHDDRFNCWSIAAYLERTEVTGRHLGWPLAFWQPRQSGCQSVCLSHSRSTSRAALADDRTSNDDRVQHRCDASRLLQLAALRRSSSDIGQASTRPE